MMPAWKQLQNRLNCADRERQEIISAPLEFVTQDGGNGSKIVRVVSEEERWVSKPHHFTTLRKDKII